MFDIIVLGSINLDIMVLTERYPDYGETAFARSIAMVPGGKGANQAVSAAKQGKKVAFIGAVGQDAAGRQMLENLQSYGVNTDCILQDPEHGTGTFIPIVDAKGENTMLGTHGANAVLTAEYVENALDQLEAPILLLQMETSRESVIAAMKKAKAKGMTVILDPAPAAAFTPEVLAYADIITPNQHETLAISGIDVVDAETAEAAARVIHKLGVGQSVIKMGAGGNLVFQNGVTEYVPSLTVNAVNTVGAGDTFAGALTAAFLDKKDLTEAVRYGNIAAGLKVSRAGGQEDMPTMEEINEYIKMGP